MAKQAKIKQTDYTKGGRDLSNTAIPLYQTDLERMDQYLSDPTQYIDMYRDKYYTDTTEQSDFMRNYQRAMAQRTGANYAATSGGYSSEGQRAYDDTQRYWNDQASRLYDQGVANSAALAQQYYTNLINAAPVYQKAYEQGEAYSDIDQYNDLIDQGHNNWISSVMSTAGDVGLASGNPWGMAIGGALKLGSGFVGTDTEGALETIGAKISKKTDEQRKMEQQQQSIAASSLANSLSSLFGNRK